MSRIQTQPTNRIVKPFISPQALISSDNQSLSVVIFCKGRMSVMGLKTAPICSHHHYNITEAGAYGESDAERNLIYGLTKFYAIWCLSHSVFMNQSSMNDESSISNPPIIPHIILFRCRGYVIIPKDT